jgi:GNAT superfamily N-acetyltransferase
MSGVENVDVRLLTRPDLDGAFALSSTAGWNQRPQDWLMLLDIAPGGSFAAALGDRIVGTAIGIDYGEFGWIAMMLVDPAHRGQGLGARLLEAAMGAVPPELPIRLDATPLGRPLYQRYGFEDEAQLTRYVAEAPRVPDGAPPADDGGGVRSLTSGDLPGIVRRDPPVFRGRRAAVLEWAFEHGPHYAFVDSDAAGVSSYCLGREGRLFDQIGPVVARDPQVASALVAAALRTSGVRPVVIDAYDAAGDFAAFAGACGFAPQRPLYRMCRPGRTSAVATTRAASGLTEFAILGPEFG